MESSADAVRRSRRRHTTREQGRLAAQTSARTGQLRPLVAKVVAAAARRERLAARLDARIAGWDRQLEAKIARQRAEHAERVRAERARFAQHWEPDEQWGIAFAELMRLATVTEAAAALGVSEHQIRMWRTMAGQRPVPGIES